MEETKPNKSELLFLTLAYNRFYDLQEEFFSAEFWRLSGFHRLSKIKDIFSIYSEILDYEPVKWTIEQTKASRPPGEAELAEQYFKFVRNLISHFPLFESWDEIWFNRPLVNWSSEGKTIDRFIKGNLGKPEVKYRIWEESKKEFTFVTLSFPSKYEEDKIHLKSMISEKEGVKFALVLMRKVIDTQVERFE
jgi:hypothetical protein